MPSIFIGAKLTAMHTIMKSLMNTAKMPVLFLGHGSPMNAIEDNSFVQGFRNISSEIETPVAILVISAHWETYGTKVTAMQNPPTIHDFGGFPPELFAVQYPAPGHPELAKDTKALVKSAEVQLDEKWGLDHGAWSVLKHLYPEANIPVIQLSIDYNRSPAEHYALAKELGAFRNKGILIVGSGNIIHNLRMIDWQRSNEEFAYDWALEASNKMNAFILNGDHNSLINYPKQGNEFKLSIPTPEHFIPLLYALSLQDKQDHIQLFNDKPVAGSLSMTSVKIG